MPQPSLPIELFELIVCHIQDRGTLLSLLLTSRALNYDAERVLYRDVVLGEPDAFVHALASHIAGCSRIAPLVQSLTIDPNPSEEQTYLSREQIRNVLCATCNLKSLCMRYSPAASQETLSYLTNGVSFQLQTLDIGYYHHRDFKHFMHSQRQISSMIWLTQHNTPNSFPAISDLSNISILGTYSSAFIAYILPHCQLRRLQVYDLDITYPAPSIEVLSCRYYIPVTFQPVTLFPGLRCLEMLLPHKSRLAHYIQLPPGIERLKILIRRTHDPGLHQELFNYVRRLFKNNVNMRHVELGYLGGIAGANKYRQSVFGVKAWLVEGEERKSETFQLDEWDWEEWMTW